MPREEWRRVPGFPNYEVSNRANLRRISPPLRLRTSPNHQGYILCHLREPNGRMRTQGIHRLMLAAFVRPPLPGEQCNHRDGVKNHNRLSNLEWLTASGNCLHAAATGLNKHCSGEAHGRAKLTWSDVRAIRKMRGKVTTTELASRYGVVNQLISQIQLNQIWHEVAPPSSEGRA